MRRSDFSSLPPLVLESDDGERADIPDYPAIAKAYAEAAADGRLNVCRWIRLAAERYLRMLDMAEQPDGEFIFSPAHVVDYCSFIEKLKHVESGLWELTQRDEDGEVNPHIILEPWQIWVEAAIQGFRRRVTGERLVTTVLTVVPRKQAKSLAVAGAALFDLCCSGQVSPQITIAASTANQANRVFSPIMKFVNNDPDLVEQYKIKVTNERITTPACGEFDGITKLSSIGERQDGLNPSLAIFEEGHAGAAAVYRVVDSAFGARPNALRRMITTAGYRPEGPGWDLQLEAQMILDGKAEDYSFFAAIYTLDREDYIDSESNAINWDKLFGDERLIEKANPMYGVSLDPIKIRGDMEKARRRPDLRGEVARTRFNIWTGSGQSLIEPTAWAACKRQIKLEDFIGQRCWIGVDLAQRLDMCAIALLFEAPDDALAVFAKFFLPELSPTAQDPDLSDHILSWSDADDGWLILTPGPMADHDRVRDEISAYCDVFDVQVIACDPHQAHNTATKLWGDQRPVMVYPNGAPTMTGPTDDILARVVGQKLWHDGNPVLAWNAANVHGERKGNGLILPRKEAENSKRKIDGFVAAVMANGCRMQPAIAKPAQTVASGEDPYATRGIIGFEEATHG